MIFYYNRLTYINYQLISKICFNLIRIAVLKANEKSLEADAKQELDKFLEQKRSVEVWIID